MAYLNDIQALITSKCTATTVKEFLTFSNLTHTMATRAAYYVNLTNQLLKKSGASAKEKQNDLFALQVQRAVKVHIQYLMMLMAIEKIEQYQFKDKNIAPILEMCVKVFALKMLEKDTQGLFACGYFGPDSQNLVEASFDVLMKEMRPHMVPLVEAFHLEGQDASVIGNKYGDIYELQYEVSKKAPINEKVVPEWYEKYQKPAMTMHKAKL